MTSSVMSYNLIGPKIAIPITELFNKCFLEEYFPRCFKKSIIAPIFKSGLSSKLKLH